MQRKPNQETSQKLGNWVTGKIKVSQRKLEEAKQENENIQYRTEEKEYLSQECQQYIATNDTPQQANSQFIVKISNQKKQKQNKAKKKQPNQEENEQQPKQQQTILDQQFLEEYFKNDGNQNRNINNQNKQSIQNNICGCGNEYDLKQYIPYILKCGHLICKNCLFSNQFYVQCQNKSCHTEYQLNKINIEDYKIYTEFGKGQNLLQSYTKNIMIPIIFLIKTLKKKQNDKGNILFGKIPFLLCKFEILNNYIAQKFIAIPLEFSQKITIFDIKYKLTKEIETDFIIPRGSQTLIWNNKILILGGYLRQKELFYKTKESGYRDMQNLYNYYKGYKIEYTQKFYQVDPNGKTVELPDMNLPRVYFAAAVYKNTVFVFGHINFIRYGRRAENFDLGGYKHGMPTWKYITDMPKFVSMASALCHEKSKSIYLTGGYQRNNNLSYIEAEDCIQIYNIAADFWQIAGKMPSCLFLHGSVCSTKDKFIVFGGFQDSQVQTLQSTNIGFCSKQKFFIPLEGFIRHNPVVYRNNAYFVITFQDQKLNPGQKNANKYQNCIFRLNLSTLDYCIEKVLVDNIKRVLFDCMQ